MQIHNNMVERQMIKSLTTNTLHSNTVLWRGNIKTFSALYRKIHIKNIVWMSDMDICGLLAISYFRWCYISLDQFHMSD